MGSVLAKSHFPHLPVGMDTFLVEKVCEAASARTGVPMLSALRYTVSQGHTPKWPGTFSLRHGTFVSVIREIAEWAAATGWKRLLLVNSHFGNDAPARAAVDQVPLEHMGRLQIVLSHVFQTGEGVWDAYTSDADDLHANRAETSLMLHLHPDPGECLCGAVRYSVAGPVLGTTLCHCIDCRRASGAPMVAWSFFREGSLKWLAGEPKVIGFADRERSFCGDCGTPLKFYDPELPEIFEVSTCSPDESHRFEPGEHCWVADEVAWMGKHGQLRRYEFAAPLPEISVRRIQTGKAQPSRGTRLAFPETPGGEDQRDGKNPKV